MRYVGLFLTLVFAGFALVGGCTSDDSTGGGIVLAQGTITVPGGSLDLVTVEVNEPGTLRGTITWSGPPTELFAVFIHVVPNDAYGLAQSPSPLTAVSAVTSARVAAGTQWTFRTGNTTSTGVSVQYAITFIPD